jgi:hypothetical protein
MQLESYKISYNCNYKKTCPKAIELLKAHPNKIDWEGLSNNKNAFELLLATPTKIEWSNFSRCEFTYDNEKIKALNQLGVFKQIPYFQF